MTQSKLRLTELREAKGWSKNELARQARISPGDAGKIESGRLRPYPSQLTKIAAALGVPEAEAGSLVEEVGG